MLAHLAMQKLANYTQHHHSDRLTHSIAVSYDSYRIAKKFKLDYKSIVRDSLLHDLFYYDCRKVKFALGTHAYVHPRIALRNEKKITDLNDKEKDIIIKHMFGATITHPKYLESWIMSLVDDYSA